MAPTAAAADLGGRVVMRCAVVVAIACASSVASADLANNEAIHAHVDTMLSHVDTATLDRSKLDEVFAGRLTLSLGAVVPIFGSYVLDHKVFGGVRPAAVVFDWLLGGVAPAALGITALEDGSLSSRTRSILEWSAIALYASPRVGVIVVGNVQISEYNHFVKLWLGIAESPAGQMTPAIVATSSW